ncbi:BPSL0761 family protein [Paraburkholderia xenovorans]|uniref:BPSL0761 family protein n=1 Tax=Paraburkholderia xenovorans TaxID=36873 RepID=UPI0038BCAA81
MEKQLTTPAERTCALLQTREFLVALTRRSTLDVPEKIRAEAAALLRHYPDAGDMSLIASGRGNWLAPPE